MHQTNKNAMLNCKLFSVLRNDVVCTTRSCSNNVTCKCNEKINKYIKKEKAIEKRLSRFLYYKEIIFREKLFVNIFNIYQCFYLVFFN